ncbi:MAG TPA: DUF1214 domain-containing protein [Chitinophagales bacterium]|nr:DUF1214 domain-containing protein [Chitinophagales bacterium]
MKIKHILIIIPLAVLLGTGIALARIARIDGSPAFAHYGAWRGTTSLLLSHSDLVTTQVTAFALFALPATEAVYLFALNDDNHQRLNGNESYLIKGNVHDIKVGYWSITAYGKDLFLIANDENKYSFNGNNLITDSTGNFEITLSAERKGNNWLPVKKGEKFELLLRLYQANPDFVTNLDKAHLPEIKKL